MSNLQTLREINKIKKIEEESTMLKTIAPILSRCHSSLHLTLRSRKAFGTLEVVIIIAVILSIALLFRKTLSAYATNLINTVFAGDPLAN